MLDGRSGCTVKELVEGVNQIMDIITDVAPSPLFLVIVILQQINGIS